MPYKYYVVDKESGRVVAGNDYREDANDAREDSPFPKSQTQVLTAAGVRRKYGKIRWLRDAPRSNPRYHGELVDYQTGEVVRYASRDEREDSNHATLDDEGRGLIEGDDGRTYYVNDSGVRDRDGTVYDSPYDYVLAVEGDGGDTPELILHGNGWHDDDGLVLTLV
ncbi:unnamed protein product [marine sediment metagenome]|uniref:Uncharacterized protein n=1 Tax=marine sediment metagenome TaxID=412755 RepID=X0T6L5_9ZZZZ